MYDINPNKTILTFYQYNKTTCFYSSFIERFNKIYLIFIQLRSLTARQVLKSRISFFTRSNQHPNISTFLSVNKINCKTSVKLITPRNFSNDIFILNLHLILFICIDIVWKPGKYLVSNKNRTVI